MQPSWLHTRLCFECQSIPPHLGHGRSRRWSRVIDKVFNYAQDNVFPQKKKKIGEVSKTLWKIMPSQRVKISPSHRVCGQIEVSAKFSPGTSFSPVVPMEGRGPWLSSGPGGRLTSLGPPVGMYGCRRGGKTALFCLSHLKVSLNSLSYLFCLKKQYVFSIELENRYMQRRRNKHS